MVHDNCDNDFEWQCKKWSQHNGGNEPASAGATDASHNTLSQGSRWPSQDSNQAHPDYKLEVSLLEPTWLAALQGQTVSSILFYRHPVAFKELKYKQTVAVKTNNIFGFLYVF
jgi:hypothetical protein